MDGADDRLPRLAARLKEGPLPPPPDFTHGRDTPYFPPRGAAWAAPFFFVAVKHLFGMWTEEAGAFAGEVAGRIDGRPWSGEAYAWMALARTAQEEPDFLLPAAQAALTDERMARAFRDDAGRCPIPLVPVHAELARAWGRAMAEGRLTANKVLDEARRAPDALRRFVEVVSGLPGYREDPLQRKSFLLALILSRRPEGFLPAAGAEWPPVADRHLLRAALRWGAVEAPGGEVQARLAQGRPVPPPVEEALRHAAYGALARVLADAGRSVPETAGLLLSAGSWCDEAAPDCPRCFFKDACARRTALKGPFVRTTAY